MSKPSRKASISQMPDRNDDREPAAVTFAEGDLGLIQSILFRSASLEIEQRIAELEKANQAQFEALEQRLSEKLEHLVRLDSQKVRQEHLARLLADLSRDVGGAGA